MGQISIFSGFFAALATALLIGLASKAISAHNPIGASTVTGTVTPDRRIAYFTLIIGSVMFFLSVFATFHSFDEMIVYGPACAAMGAAIAISSIPNLTPIHDIMWNSESLRGPSAIKFQIMRLSRNELTWAEIVNIGLVKGPYYFVEDRNGDRIYWSRSYKNYENFEATVRENCPSLIWPEYTLSPE